MFSVSNSRVPAHKIRQRRLALTVRNLLLLGHYCLRTVNFKPDEDLMKKIPDKTDADERLKSIINKARKEALEAKNQNGSANAV